jgi:hypothetical protein
MIMQSGRHKSVEANALYQDPTLHALAHRSKVLQYDPERDGVQIGGEIVLPGTRALATETATMPPAKKTKKKKSKKKAKKMKYAHPYNQASFGYPPPGMFPPFGMHPGAYGMMMPPFAMHAPQGSNQYHPFMNPYGYPQIPQAHSSSSSDNSSSSDSSSSSDEESD